MIAWERLPVQSSRESFESYDAVWLNTVTLASTISFSDPAQQIIDCAISYSVLFCAQLREATSTKN
jgi:hypothetical protein